MSHDRYQVAKRTSYVNATINTLLAIFKIIVGWLGQSSALMADGVHSFSDLISDGLVLIASKAGTKHPDEGHPYGHQRIETFAAIIVALLFLGAGVYIIYDAIIHLIQKAALHHPDFLVLIVAGVSIIANEWLFRYTLKAGKAVNSNLVITNAWHNRSDVYVSGIVFISVGFTFFGLHYFDAIGAAIVALLIVKMGVKMAWESINELLDAAVDEKTLGKIRHIIELVHGVVSVHQLRTRLHGGTIFVDVHIQVHPKISVSEGHHIGETVALRLIQECKQVSDVTVHIDPEDDEQSKPSINLPLRTDLHDQLNDCWRGLPGYKESEMLHLHYLDGQLQIELLLPLTLLQNYSAEEL
ncbi:MAG: cation transporter, partial [Coxiellaceae bacterium]|nr:cation transporter [Coxiellaceae bacterium]